MCRHCGLYWDEHLRRQMADGNSGAVLVPYSGDNLHRDGVYGSNKTQGLVQDVEDEQFWKSLRKSPTETFGDARYRFRQLDLRMQRIERYVTSRRFRLDREFRDLEKGSP